MIDAEIKALLDELRAQQVTLTLKLNDLAGQHGKSKEDIDDLADTRADLRAALEDLRAEIKAKDDAIKLVRTFTPGLTGIKVIDDIL